MDQKLNVNWEKGKLGNIQLGLLILSFASAIFSFMGFTVEASDLAELALGGVFAMASGVGIYLAWDHIIKIVPFQRTAKNIAKCLGLTACWCIIAICLSSVLNVAGMRGHDAMEMHLSNYVELAESALDRQQSGALLLDSLSTDMRLEAARYRKAAKDELKSGAYTGSPGPGDVMKALNAIAGRLENSLTEVANQQQAANAGLVTARSKLDQMRQIATDETSLEERLRLMARASNRLRQDLKTLDHRPLAKTLQRVLASLPREVDTHVKLSRKPDLARRQRAAMKRVHQDIVQTATVLNAFIDEALSEDQAELETLEDMTPYKAVLIYWDQYIPFWAAGVGLDILPLIIILFSLVSLSSKTDAERAFDKLRRMTLDEFIFGQMADGVIKRAAIDPQSIEHMHDLMLGRKQLPKPDENDPKGGEGT